MDLREAISSRRSIRKFKKDDVSFEKINELLYYATLAPSSKNAQPWRFVILKNTAKEDIAKMMLDWASKPENDSDDWVDLYRNTIDVISQAPVLIIVYRRIRTDWVDSDIISIGAAIEHICLMALDLGLGSLIIGDIREVKEEVNKYLGIEDMELQVALSIGYADESPEPRRRRSVKDVTIIQKT